MARAGTYNIVIEQGATFALDLIYKNSAGEKEDLSGNYTARIQIRDSPGGGLIDSSDSSPGNITLGSVNSADAYTAGAGNLGDDNANATIRIGIPASATTNYDFDTAFYDLELAGASETERVIEGKVTLKREITQ